MLKGYPEEKTIDFACALAACVCMSFPGVLNAPSYEEVECFIKSRNDNRVNTQIKKKPEILQNK